MPFKDKSKENEYKRKYWAARPAQRKAIRDRWAAKHHDEILAYQREYTKRPEVKERRRKQYLEHREEYLLNAKRNRLMKRYEQKSVMSTWKRRKAGRDYARRKRLGIVIEMVQGSYFWKAGKISNGPFDYRKDAIKDAERAFL